MVWRKQGIVSVLVISPSICFALVFGGGGGGGGTPITASSTVTVAAVLITGQTSPTITASDSTTVELSVAGTSVVKLTTSTSNHAQMLVRDQLEGDKPNIASFNYPTTGINVGSQLSIIKNGGAIWTLGTKSGPLGTYAGITISGGTVKDNEIGPPQISPEGTAQYDGISWVDNRLPDGVVGHDASGRFVMLEVNKNRMFRVGSNGVGVHISTSSGSIPGGSLAVGATNGQFVIDGSTSTGSNTVGLGTVSPAQNGSTPVWVKIKLCQSDGSNCLNYFMPSWPE
jgi:hypothetical protein